MFSAEQTTAFNAYIEGKNVFLTGPGGTGKSHWIKSVYAHCKKSIQVCALTGCAAILLECNAKTLHSWAGIGKGDNCDKALSNKYVRDRWRSTEVLIVDEISMLSKRLFEMLDSLGKHFRNSTKPFGGIQLLFCGDFYQLPPIEPGFCFESPIWKDSFTTILLTTIFRQTNEEYQCILSEIRTGKISKKSRDILMGRIGSGGLTRLVPTRYKADMINSTEYKVLQGPEYIYEMIPSEKVLTLKERAKRNSFSADQIASEYTYLKKHIRCEPSLKLKVGSRVMCIINLTDEICNGSQGIITRFNDRVPVVQYAKTEMIMEKHTWESETIPGIGIDQYPLIYAWAITIHKSQGSSLDSAEIDIGNDIFECGQTYVALSRVKSLEGLFLTEFNPNKIKLDSKVVHFYSNI